jgi:hypothetical protein
VSRATGCRKNWFCNAGVIAYLEVQLELYFATFLLNSNAWWRPDSGLISTSTRHGVALNFPLFDFEDDFEGKKLIRLRFVTQ